jgi:hypothetical protein
MTVSGGEYKSGLEGKVQLPDEQCPFSLILVVLKLSSLEPLCYFGFNDLGL